MQSLRHFLWFAALLLLQVLVFNHIHIRGYATPFPFIYLLLILHSQTPRWIYVAAGFAIGLTIDIFSNTLGECAAAATLLGLISPRLLQAFAPADQGDDGFQPSADTIKWSGFFKLALTSTLLFTVVFYLLECFSFLHPTDLALHIGGSTVITLVIICAIERIRLSIND